MAPKKAGLGNSTTSTSPRILKRERDPLYPQAFIQSSSRSSKKSPNPSNNNSNTKSKVKRNTLPPTSKPNIDKIRPALSENTIDPAKANAFLQFHSDRTSTYSQSTLRDPTRANIAQKRKSLTSGKSISSTASGQMVSNAPKRRLDNSGLSGSLNKTGNKSKKAIKGKEKIKVSKSESGQIKLDANIPIEIENNSETTKSDDSFKPIPKASSENNKHDELISINKRFINQQQTSVETDNQSGPNDLNDNLLNDTIPTNEPEKLNSNEPVYKLTPNEQEQIVSYNVNNEKVDSNEIHQLIEYENGIELSPIHIPIPNDLNEIVLEVDIDNSHSDPETQGNVTFNEQIITNNDVKTLMIENQELFDQSPINRVFKYEENSPIVSINHRNQLQLSGTQSVFNQSRKHQTSSVQHEEMKNPIRLDENNVCSLSIDDQKVKANKPLQLQISDSLQTHLQNQNARLEISTTNEIFVSKNDDRRSNKSLCLSTQQYDFIDASPDQQHNLKKDKYIESIKELEDEFTEAAEILNNISSLKLFNVEFTGFK